MGMYALIPFWLVYFLGMGVYRFPTRTPIAVTITTALLAQLLIYWHFVEGGIFFAAYVVFLSSFYGTALFLFAALLSSLFGQIGKTRHHSTLPLTTLLLGFTAFFAYGLTKPLLITFQSLQGKTQLLAVLAFATTSFIIAFAGYQSTQESSDTERKMQWKRWTSPVAGALIISLLSTFGVLFTL